MLPTFGIIGKGMQVKPPFNTVSRAYAAQNDATLLRYVFF